MPLRKELKKVLVIGSGPIIIGQAAEFDYAGTQACKALKEDGICVVLVNSNPATIMTDKHMADKIYLEPLNIDVLKRIIEIESPDAVLSNLGGQMGLNLSIELAESGFLDAHGVKLLGAKVDTIRKAEDRQAFKDTMEEIGEPCIASKVVTTIEDAVEFAGEIEYPVIVRPAYTMGGTGGGRANDEAQLREISEAGIRASRVGQILIEKCVAGWKEIEYEVMRDSAGNAISICNMENVDPVGVHTGDSIVVAPTQTLSAVECARLRASALKIVCALGVEGGCNVQFAVNPDSFEYAVIEVNPRVSRSSALASKATGYPIARVASKIAIGYNLDEIKNSVTGTTFASSEPSIDYIVLKFPKWPFDKFVYGDRTLGTQMKATGEVMCIADSFEAALMKAVRCIELKLDRMYMPHIEEMELPDIIEDIKKCNDERIFYICAALRRGVKIDEIYDITKMDRWFINKLQGLINMEYLLEEELLTPNIYREAKKMGFLDSTIEALSGEKIKTPIKPVYKMVDTCAGEIEAKTPYYYSTYDEDNEARPSDKKKILVFGSGPIRIGQGIEFDYCSVHCVWALKNLGYETIIANNNPETVSTDFDTSDRLYFEPLTREDVLSILETEKPDGAIVQFGGQTAINLVQHIKDSGVKILGTQPDMIDAAEDREIFDGVLERCGIPRPKSASVYKLDEALAAANDIGYPVLVRPSYVLGGKGMVIAYNDDDVKEFMGIINREVQEHPILIDKYMMGKEVEVDAISDGEDILIPGIMEHLERAGVHSGDSISVYPAYSLSDEIKKTIVEYTAKLAKELKVLGLINIQYVVYNGEVYVIEVNPRSSRTVPYISKVTNIPMIELATRCILGEPLKSLGYGTGIYKESDYFAVKVPVFSFEKLHDVDTQLGPEMKSTGEVLGLARTFDEALLKGLTASGYKLNSSGGVLFSIRDKDKPELPELARKFVDMGFAIYGTGGTARYLRQNGIDATSVKKISEDKYDNVLNFIESGKVNYVISTSTHGRQPQREGVRIRRKSVERGVVCLTSFDTANAVVECLKLDKKAHELEMVNIADV
ncbi:MAG: carbamoyl-phosphate synthase large subunit [Clostridia bacterium]|nr:carbamoyl-phosphate synthase large subunit [Clostridia bacterium]